MRLGLRIDVDTFRGTKIGVPNLNRLFKKHGIKASYFFSVGPDNMGRHLFRLLKPEFFKKMLRSNAASLYGWDILLRGTLWPGPEIGKKMAGPIKSAADDGHEIGIHAWDHHRWQTKIEHWDAEAIQKELALGVMALRRLGIEPTASAVPAWKCSDETLIQKTEYPFKYNSDCRGTTIFFPKIGEKVLPQPQIPVNLPTFDELIGSNGVTDQSYNQTLLSLLEENQLNILTIHAEVEGIAYLDMFEEFLLALKAKGVVVVPLSAFLGDQQTFPSATLTRGTVPGREGWVSVQGQLERTA